MERAQHEKNLRREANARAKKDLIDNKAKDEKFIAVVNKISKIREVNTIKQTELQFRRQKALENQERLREYIEDQKRARVDLKPLQYTES